MRHKENTGGHPAGSADAAIDQIERLRTLIDHAAHFLPAQGPITVFIHHNTLHAFEHLPFHDAVLQGGRMFGCEPYLSEDRYRQELHRGRIRLDELLNVVRGELPDPGEKLINSTSILDMRSAMLQFTLREAPTVELRWFMAESDALRHFLSETPAGVRSRLIAETRHWAMRDLRPAAEGAAQRAEFDVRHLFERFGTGNIEQWDDATWEAFTLESLWQACHEGMAAIPAVVAPRSYVRHRDLIVAAGGDDADARVHDAMIRFAASYVDQGLAQWQLPERDQGMYRAFLAVFANVEHEPEIWKKGFAAELRRLRDQQIAPLQSIAESLAALGVPDDEWDAYLTETLLALPGWGGIIRFLEEREDRAVRRILPGTLFDFLAIRLLLDRWSLPFSARRSVDDNGPLDRLRERLRPCLPAMEMPSVEQRCFPIFQLAQVLGWTPSELSGLPTARWQRLVAAIDAFPSIERRRVFHLAFENRFYRRTLDALIINGRYASREPELPEFQAVFCIDEREESLRRHLEEVSPGVATYGMAGFFAAAMYYRGAADAHFVPLCPAIMRPRHWVTEEVFESHELTHRRRRKARRALGMASHQLHVGSRSFAIGAILTTALGVLATLPLVARTLFPRLTSRVRRLLSGFLSAPPATRLKIERSAADPCEHGDGVGYNVDEMTAIAERMLNDTGIACKFSRLIFTFGHGSTSMNNPHASAYDCGACGGSRGGPNGRAIAQILNDPRVRERLAQRGIRVPVETIFVGGMHNTSCDEIALFDLERLPDSHRAEFQKARQLIEQACERNAHERSRRFVSAPLDMSFKQARQHVEGRSQDLAQARPECGHATNAICFVGRRRLTRGLFYDRRAFLNSYDPTIDTPDAAILTRILQAVFPVCGGINLEYYFSYVDNARFGCGSKLPHNITSLIGVMDGAASDLRTGLPWQMVEIHEPVRLLIVIENTPAVVLEIMEKQPPIKQLIVNSWVHVATIDPTTSDVHLFSGGRFVPYQCTTARLPHVDTSVDWYRGWREHLDFALVGPTEAAR